MTLSKSRLLPDNFFPIATVALATLLTGCSSQKPTEPEDVSEERKAISSEAERRWVYLAENGTLVYETDARGNRIPDFSNAGYGGGGVAIPDAPVKITLTPSEGDNTSKIQAAIDQLAALERDSSGFRGALLLKRGTYRIDGKLLISASGIVIRGEGQDEDGSILIATGATQRTLIEVSGKGRPREIPETRRKILDRYVPVGAKSFEIENADGFEIGDKIMVFRPSTEEWISTIGMDSIPPRADGLPIHQWTAGSRNISYDRVITAIDGNKITIDSPIFNAIDEEFGGGSVYKYDFLGRIEQIGIEHLRGISEFAGEPSENDEDHGWIFVSLDSVQNAWVRNVTSKHFGFGLARVQRYAKWITIQDSICLEPVSIVRGGRRYPFYLGGQLALVQRCYANRSRHDFGINSLVPGPNVFLDCYASDSRADSGPHHRWATGALFDNIRVPDHSIRIINRLNLGSGHGWAGANMVVWNSEAKTFIVQNPPTAQNWAIGNMGEIGKPPFEGDQAYFVSHGNPVEPRSLYLAQLRERLGDQAVERIAEMDIRSPIRITPELWD